MTDRAYIVSRTLENKIAIAENNNQNTLFVTLDVLKEILALLKEQEAKTGKWIEQTDYMGDTYYDCSVCNESWMTIEGTPWVNGMNYCPHCGAKMEGR